MRLINPLIILRILSVILLIESASYIPAAIVAYFYNEPLNPFIYSALITLFVSTLFTLIIGRSDTGKAGNRDTFLVVTISWLLFSLFGALPYIFSSTIPSFIDAFFESASGFSTTGASILTDVEKLPYSILFWRSLTHWIGGVGIIALVIIILPSLKITGYQLFSLESSLKEKIHPKTIGVGFRVVYIYTGLTVAETLFLYAGDMNLFDSVCHSFGTIATGGFSTKNNSLQYYSAYSQYIVLIFMFLSGISQIVYYHLFKRNFRKVKQNEELWFYIAVVLITGTMAACFLYLRPGKDIEEALRSGFFQVVSIISCTGFATDDFIYWPAAGICLLFLLMFAGGSTGSTSGGIKMARHLITFKNIRRALIRLSHPKALAPVRFNGKIVDDEANISIISFIGQYLFLFIIGTVILTFNGSDIITSSSSVATCMAGIGPGFGSVGPMSNYSAVPELSKIVLSLLMIIGRLEIMTVFVLFSKTFWKI